MTLEHIFESVELLEADRDKRTVTQIIIRAGESKNQRIYPETVLKSAVSLFEHVRTYANHPTAQDMKQRPERSISDITGWLSDVHYDESHKAIIGTRHFTKNQAGQDAWALAEMVVYDQAPPTLFGASINALGVGKKRDDGMLEVAEITKAISVDDVTSPAAGGGFEKLVASEGGIVQAVLDQITFEQWFEARPEYIKRVQKEMKLTRQSKVYQEAQAKADQQVKVVQAKADELEATVKETQDKLTAQAIAYEAAMSELEMVRRELLVEKALQKTRLPVEWRDSLRQRLLDSDPSKWGDIVADEQVKAKRISKPKIEGMGSRRIHESVKVSSPSPSPYATDNEGFDAWRQRIEKLKARQ